MNEKLPLGSNNLAKIASDIAKRFEQQNQKIATLDQIGNLSSMIAQTAASKIHDNSIYNALTGGIESRLMDKVQKHDSIVLGGTTISNLIENINQFEDKLSTAELVQKGIFGRAFSDDLAAKVKRENNMYQSFLNSSLSISRMFMPNEKVNNMFELLTKSNRFGEVGNWYNAFDKISASTYSIMPEIVVQSEQDIVDTWVTDPELKAQAQPFIEEILDDKRKLEDILIDFTAWIASAYNKANEEARIFAEAFATQIKYLGIVMAMIAFYSNANFHDDALEDNKEIFKLLEQILENQSKSNDEDIN